MDEGVPLPQYEEEREQGRDPQEAAEARAEQRPHQPQGVAEKGIRPQDGDAEEEVVGHQKPEHAAVFFPGGQPAFAQERLRIVQQDLL